MCLEHDGGIRDSSQSRLILGTSAPPLAFLYGSNYEAFHEVIPEDSS